MSRRHRVERAWEAVGTAKLNDLLLDMRIQRLRFATCPEELYASRLPWELGWEIGWDFLQEIQA